MKAVKRRYNTLIPDERALHQMEKIKLVMVCAENVLTVGMEEVDLYQCDKAREKALGALDGLATVRAWMEERIHWVQGYLQMDYDPDSPEGEEERLRMEVDCAKLRVRDSRRRIKEHSKAAKKARKAKDFRSESGHLAELADESEGRLRRFGIELTKAGENLSNFLRKQGKQ